MNYSIKINLLKVKNASLINLKGKNATKKCLIIPIDESGLFVGEKGIYLDVKAYESKESNFDQTHLLKQSIDHDTYITMTDEERNEIPILGSIREMVRKEVQPEKTTYSIDVDNPADDLPF